MNLDMTLREFFELSERMAAAARVIRESQAALGAPARPEHPPVTPTEMGFAVHADVVSRPAVQWSPEELALRARLKAEREAASKKLEEVVLESRS